MPKGRAWTYKEEQFVIENSEKLSLEEIAQSLNRTPHAVEVRWYEMKQDGRAKGSLRHWKTRLVWCEECSAWRRKGKCRVCNERKKLQKTRDKEAELYSQLNPDNKLRKRPQVHGSKVTPRPKPKDTSGMTPYYKDRVEEIYNMALETWALENIHREQRAIQKRCERLRKELDE